MSDARDKAIERLARIVDPHYDNEHAMLDQLFRELGLVAVDPELIEAVEKARANLVTNGYGYLSPDGKPLPVGDLRKLQTDEALANAALADAVLAQLRGGW